MLKIKKIIFALEKERPFIYQDRIFYFKENLYLIQSFCDVRELLSIVYSITN